MTFGVNDHTAVREYGKADQMTTWWMDDTRPYQGILHGRLHHAEGLPHEVNGQVADERQDQRLPLKRPDFRRGHPPAEGNLGREVGIAVTGTGGGGNRMTLPPIRAIV